MQYVSPRSLSYGGERHKSARFKYLSSDSNLLVLFYRRCPPTLNRNFPNLLNKQFASVDSPASCNGLGRTGSLSGLLIVCIVFMVKIAFVKVMTKDVNKDICVRVIRKTSCLAVDK